MDKKSFLYDTKAQLNIRAILEMAIGIFVLVYILPPAFDNFYGVNTTLWDAEVAHLWYSIPGSIIAKVIRSLMERP